MESNSESSLWQLKSIPKACGLEESEVVDESTRRARRNLLATAPLDPTHSSSLLSHSVKRMNTIGLGSLSLFCVCQSVRTSTHGEVAFVLSLNIDSRALLLLLFVPTPRSDACQPHAPHFSPPKSRFSSLIPPKYSKWHQPRMGIDDGMSQSGVNLGCSATDFPLARWSSLFSWERRKSLVIVTREREMLSHNKNPNSHPRVNSL